MLIHYYQCTHIHCAVRCTIHVGCYGFTIKTLLHSYKSDHGNHDIVLPHKYLGYELLADMKRE